LLGEPIPTASSYTVRERECLALLSQGFSDGEIARVLGVAASTVRFHLSNAREKSGARNRVDLAVRSLSLE